MKSTDYADTINTCLRYNDGSKAMTVGKMAWNPSKDSAYTSSMAPSTYTSCMLRIQCLRGKKEEKENQRSSILINRL